MREAVYVPRVTVRDVDVAVPCVQREGGDGNVGEKLVDGGFCDVERLAWVERRGRIGSEAYKVECAVS